MNKKIFQKELIIGLSKKNKIIPSKYHYDYQGSKYFEKITKQTEYYPTRKENEILKKVSKKLPKMFKGNLSFCEIGSGAVDKIQILINKNVKFYFPIDISAKFIRNASKKLKKKYPKLKIKPVIADYNKPFKIPNFNNTTKVFFFLGSSIGNFHPGHDVKFLKNLSKCIDKKSFVFIGVDLVKKASIINKAYNDRAGYTAKFSLNLINIINRNFNSGLNINNFSYIGIYNNKLKSLQGFLVSKVNQSFKIGSKNFNLKKNEKIQVEVSNKFTPTSFKSLVKSGNFKIHSFWTDKLNYFSLFLLKR
tara:strand:+ start:2528 stop:3442 length:915 start_codon:yes stop_codon:yes gene_type:complete